MQHVLGIDAKHRVRKTTPTIGIVIHNHTYMNIAISLVWSTWSHELASLLYIVNPYMSHPVMNEWLKVSKTRYL